MGTTTRLKLTSAVAPVLLFASAAWGRTVRQPQMAPDAPEVVFARASAYIVSGWNLQQTKTLLRRYAESPIAADDPRWSEVTRLLAKASRESLRGNRMGAGYTPQPFYFLTLLLGTTAWAGSTIPVTIEAGRPVLPAAVALDRYFAAAPHSTTWTTETIEIDASLPKLAEHGRLRAIRRLLPFGQPEYQVLATDGDRTVRQQVIARYLSAEAESANLSPTSVAITPGNYRFRYAASISEGDTHIHIFEITPRKKRPGLIKGQLWIDAATGVAVRQTGYVVRTPSIFIRRINVTRDTLLRDGVAYAKTTQLQIDTRLVGRANLTITERPFLPERGEDAGGTR